MKRETDAAILTAARKVFSDQGYHGASVSQIISAVGMAQGSFYNYYRSKQDLFKRILEELVYELLQCIHEVSVDDVVDRDSYKSVGRYLATNLSTFFITNADLARIFFWEAGGAGGFDELIDDTYFQVTKYTQSYIERGQAIGVARKELDSHLAASAMVGMCSHLINRFLRGDFVKNDPLEIIETILTLHLEGMLYDN